MPPWKNTTSGTEGLVDYDHFITMDSAPPSKAKVFLRRLISSVVLWTIVLIGLFSSNRLLSNYLFLTIIVVLAVTGLAEFYGLAQKRDLVCFNGWGIVGGLLLMI